MGRIGVTLSGIERSLLNRLAEANTAATLLSDPSLHYDMVRVGLGTYGLYPAPHLKSAIALKPVLEVKARITHLKNIRRFEVLCVGVYIHGWYVSGVVWNVVVACCCR